MPGWRASVCGIFFLVILNILFIFCYLKITKTDGRQPLLPPRERSKIVRERERERERERVCVCVWARARGGKGAGGTRIL